MRQIFHSIKIKRELKLLAFMLVLSANIQLSSAKVVDTTMPEAAYCPQLACYKVEFETEGYTKERKNILEYLHKEYGKYADSGESFNSHSIGIAKFDLNSDGKDEILSYWYQPSFCGSAGCNFMVFDNKFKLLEPFSHLQAKEQILILKEKINSYHPFALPSGWAYWNVWAWNGKEYVLENKILMVKDGCIDGSGYQVDFDLNLPLTEREQILQHISNEHLGIDMKKSDISFGKHDLNDDGSKEILVYYPNAQSDKSGEADHSGDSIFVLSNDLKPIIKLPNATNRAIVLKEKVNSHHSLALYDADLDHWKVWKWDGTKYSLTK
jgi:hypothetical protein